MSNITEQAIVPKGKVKKVNPAGYPHRRDPGGQMGELPSPRSVATSPIQDELAKLRAAATSVQKIRLSAQHELELARQTRANAQRYRQEMETKARSQAQQLILRTRLATQKEIEELLRESSAEIQKLLADIRMLRITVQEELAAKQKLTDATELCSLALTLQEETAEPEEKRKKQLACKK